MFDDWKTGISIGDTEKQVFLASQISQFLGQRAAGG